MLSNSSSDFFEEIDHVLANVSEPIQVVNDTVDTVTQGESSDQSPNSDELHQLIDTFPGLVGDHNRTLHSVLTP